MKYFTPQSGSRFIKIKINLHILGSSDADYPMQIKHLTIQFCKIKTHLRDTTIQTR
jgi:hypothetical protein